MTRTMAIFGHSHIQCLARAMKVAQTPAGLIEIVDLHAGGLKAVAEENLAQAALERLNNRAPDAVCLCVGGNVHNLFGLLEDPVPFSIGEARLGAAPADTARAFIPRSLIKDAYRSRYAGMFQFSSDVFKLLPNARRIVLEAPPPVSDWAHIQAHPGIFEPKMHLGPGPDALRLELYDVQCEVFRAFAAREGARYVSVPPAAKDEHGFLARAYYRDDPTHGNTAYGALMLKHLLATAEALP